MITYRIIQILQIIITLALTGLVLIQGKGAGLSSSFGGSFAFHRSKRGVEKVVLILTIVFGILLVINSFALILLR